MSAMNDVALIHMRVPAATKGRWIRASRAAGMRLTDWITQAVEAQMQQQLATIKIPEDVDFADLRYARDPDGAVSFDWAPIERICKASGLDIALLREGPEDNVAGLIVAWYRAHRAAGGAPDPAMEDLVGEVAIEDARDQGVSLPPGTA